MQLLLDTHLFLWWLTDNKQLSKQARTMIVEANNVYVSSASIWEAAIKIQLGKLKANINELVTAIEQEGFIELPITASQAALVVNLPPHHRDPFDRILIAQAISYPLRLLTSDALLSKYSELVTVI